MPGLHRRAGLGEQREHRGHGHRQHAVLVRTDPLPTPTAEPDGTGHAECVQGGARADDVGERVEGTDLVEVHLLRD